MSDYEHGSSRSSSPEPVKKTARKRKSDASTAPAAKKARTSNASGAPSNAAAQALITSVLSNASLYSESENPQAIGNALITIATYARDLENALAAGAGAGGSGGAPAKKTPAQLEAAVEKIRKAAVSGIKNQMKICKTGGAKWSYDGFCPEPEVICKLLGLSGPPTFKMKKFSRDEFEKHLRYIGASARYNDLSITSDINVRYNAESGEFKFTGSYGI